MLAVHIAVIAVVQQLQISVRGNGLGKKLCSLGSQFFDSLHEVAVAQMPGMEILCLLVFAYDLLCIRNDADNIAVRKNRGLRTDYLLAYRTIEQRRLFPVFFADIAVCDGDGIGDG